MYLCDICGETGDAITVEAREMMIGTREVFTLKACSSCGSLRLQDPPVDLARYYPADYYSFTAPVELVRNPLKRYLKSAWLEDALGRRNFPGRLMRGRVTSPPFLPWLRRTGIRRNHAVLDVGCGSGALLAYLHGFGFGRLSGCDPYLENDRSPAPGLLIRACGLEDIEGRFDLIIFNHSLEHVPHPHETLMQARERLVPGGWIIVRVPLADSRAYEQYGSNWVQLDAPRHLTLFTRLGLSQMAERCRLELDDHVDDSTAFQFWGSEQYCRDIPLLAPNSWLISPEQSLFSRARIDEFSRQASELNEQSRGDQACFYLQAKNG